MVMLVPYLLLVESPGNGIYMRPLLYFIYFHHISNNVFGHSVFPKIFHIFLLYMLLPEFENGPSVLSDCKYIFL